VIQLENLEFAYPDSDFRLRVKKLEVSQGELLAIIGPSGSGKTTLLRLISGIVLPQAGRVLTKGTDLTELSDSARREFRIAGIGLIFQEFELLEYLSVLDNILLPFRIHGALQLDREARDRGREIARDLGIEDKLARRPNCLSQGERQRIAVGRALVTKPDLVLADEPTGNLDPSNKSRVVDNLLDCAAAQAATLVMVTHDHDLLPRFARVVDCAEFHQQVTGPC
jgi:putative ABC transport system ATP-binding protein